MDIIILIFLVSERLNENGAHKCVFVVHPKSNHDDYDNDDHFSK